MPEHGKRREDAFVLALVIFFSSDGLVTFISGHCSFTLV